MDRSHVLGALGTLAVGSRPHGGRDGPEGGLQAVVDEPGPRFDGHGSRIHGQQGLLRVLEAPHGGDEGCQELAVRGLDLPALAHRRDPAELGLGFTKAGLEVGPGIRFRVEDVPHARGEAVHDRLVGQGPVAAGGDLAVEARDVALDIRSAENASRRRSPRRTRRMLPKLASNFWRILKFFIAFRLADRGDCLPVRGRMGDLGWPHRQSDDVRRVPC